MPGSSRTRPRRLAGDLLAETPPAQEASPDDLARVAENAFAPVPRARMIPIERIAPSGDNPRKSFERIDELAESIAASGVLQPLLVRREMAKPGYYRLIAGERRLQAAHRVRGFDDPEVRARVETLPCVIRDESDQDAFADSLAENVARNDLTRAEIMDAYSRLRDEYGWGVRQIARRTGRSVGDVSELLNLGDDPLLAPIVRDEVIAPTTASEIRRLPAALREKAIEGVRAGTVTRMSDIQRLRRESDVAWDPSPKPPAHAEWPAGTTPVEAARPRGISPEAPSANVSSASQPTQAVASEAHGREANDRSVDGVVGTLGTDKVLNIEHLGRPDAGLADALATPSQPLNIEHSVVDGVSEGTIGLAATPAVATDVDIATLVGDPVAIATALNDAWVAGIFEGEGMVGRADGERRRTWQVMVSSTDEDIIRRFAERVGLGKVYGPYNHGEDGRHWRWKVTHPDGIRLFYRRVGPWLGKRRKEKFVEALEDLEQGRR